MNVQPTNDLVDRIFERYTAPGSPGCAVAVIQDGELVYKQGYGLANLELGVPILPSTVFNIGSMAKQFTAFSIAYLKTSSASLCVLTEFSRITNGFSAKPRPLQSLL